MTLLAPQPRTAWLTDGYRRRSSPLDALVLAACIAGISLLVKLAWPRFTFWGDNAESFFPLWHMYGASIRAGAPALFQADGWGGGNVVGEAAYGVFNPVVIVNSVLISLTDRLSLASFLVMTEFLCLLGVGVYLLARSYGANRASAFTVGVIMPFAGYTMYYEAGNWASGLMSITWVCWFWWGAHEFAQAHRGPLPPIVTGLLAVTVGNPYAVLGILVVLFGLAVQAAYERRWHGLVSLLVMGATVGIVVVIIYLPLIYALPVTVRITSGGIDNKNYATPGLGDFLGMSSPSFLPRMNAWNSRWDAVPSTYVSLMVLPLLPWLRWRAARVHAGLTSVFVSGGLFMLFSLGPQNVWLFQWPIRLVEYTYVAALVVLAVVLSKGIATDRRRLRTVLTGGTVALGIFVAWASRPDLWAWHLVFAAVGSLSVSASVLGSRRLGATAIAAVAVAATAIVAPTQTLLFAWDRQQISAELDQRVPVNLNTVRQRSTLLEGTVLQIASLERLGATDAVASGTLSFANNRAAAGLSTVNRYTGIGQRDFALALGVDYRGSTPWDNPVSLAFTQLDGYSVPLVQAMGVDTLVVNNRIPDFDRLGEFTHDWLVLEHSSDRTVLRAPWSGLDPVTTTPGLSAHIESEKDASISVAVDGGSGRMLVPRTYWPGYTAISGNKRLEVRSGPAGLVEIDVPDGVREVTLDYRIPGSRTMVALALVLVFVAALQQGLWWRRRQPGHRTRARDGVVRVTPGRLDLSAPAASPRLSERVPLQEGLSWRLPSRS